jgi:hypothetical protein
MDAISTSEAVRVAITSSGLGVVDFDPGDAVQVQAGLWDLLLQGGREFPREWERVWPTAGTFRGPAEVLPQADSHSTWEPCDSQRGE